LQSVLQQTTTNHIKLPASDLLSTLQSRHGLASQKAPKLNSHLAELTEDAINQNTTNVNHPTMAIPQLVKKTGVSGETHMNAQQSNDITIPKHEKDFRSKHLIKEAIHDNDFLKYIDSLQVREIVEAMHSLEIVEGAYVIREGEAGAHLFVSAEGEFQVIKENNILGTMGAGKAFGELAILYDCKRTASIRGEISTH
jgi:cGMP-dependent protein kinase 1